MKTLTPEKIRWMEQFTGIKQEPEPQLAKPVAKAASPAQAAGKPSRRPAPVGHEDEMMAA